MAKLIKVDGSTSHVEPQNQKEGFSLEECYKYIECELIEAHLIDENLYLVCDEEGALKEDAVINKTILHKYGVTIFGNVMLCNPEEFK